MRNIVTVAATAFTFAYAIYPQCRRTRHTITLGPDEEVTEDFVPFLRWTARTRSNLRPTAELPWKNVGMYARRHPTQ